MGEVLRLDSGLAQANFGPIPGWTQEVDFEPEWRWRHSVSKRGTARGLEIRRDFEIWLRIAIASPDQGWEGSCGSLRYIKCYGPEVLNGFTRFTVRYIDI